MESLDKNKDGKLSRAEAQQSPILRYKQRPGASQFLEKLKADANLTKRDVEQAVDRIGGETVAYRQDLSSSQNDVEVFKLLDRDNSGLLDQAEMDAASELIISKDGDGDECVAFQEFFPPPAPVDPQQAAAAPMTPAAATPLAQVADMVRDISEPLLPARLLKKYDRRPFDKQLTAAELGWSAERVTAIDEDGNGKLDAAELRNLGAAAPDVDLSVDLKALQMEGGMMQVQGTGGKRLDDALRADYAKVAFSGVVVTFSLRNLDPMKSSLDNAMQVFNQLDADANGYLDKDETSMRTRFQRELFELMDVDGDAKLFADEMKEFIKGRGEPVASICKMNVYDTGYGFFMALDGNADGRVSVREMRHSAASLAQLERDGKPGVEQKEPVRHFHIEFVRGSYQLFGPSEQLLAQTPAFQQRRPSGPIWFQRMDRNNDGDLTWNEFLGPREIFHELDADGDSLVDPQEAGKAKVTSKNIRQTKKASDDNE
jgi:Ca2+-binding EF-hand superfamily protein